MLKKEETGLLELKIEKINLDQPIYNFKSKNNNVEANVTLLEGSVLPDKADSVLFLAAHSGPGSIAYFNDLDKLKKKDRVIVQFQNQTYFYTIINIWEEPKEGYIHVNKTSEKQLILTTCSKKDKTKQLVIQCIEKKNDL